MSETVLVTGAGGYLGSRIVEHLAKSGNVGIIAVHRTGTAPRPAACVRHAACALQDQRAVESLFAAHSPGAVVHAAAWIPGLAGVEKPVPRAIDDNVRSTANLAAAAMQSGVKRFVLCSTVEVYADRPFDGIAHKESDPIAPSSAYGCSKAAAEMITRLLDGTATVPVIVRMPGIHGLPRTSGLVHNVISAALADAPIEIQEPDSRLSILMLHHAAAALAGMATAGIHSGARILNLATGSMDLGRLARLVVELTGSSSIIRLGSKAARIRALDCSLAERLPANAAYGIEQALADEIALHRAR